MSEQEVVALMKSSRNEDEWNNNIDKMEEACGGYPHFWLNAIILSGVADKVRKSWMQTAIRGNLAALMPEVESSFMKTVHLLPPDEEEIARMKEQRANRG